AVASHPALDEQAAALAQSVLRRKNLDYRLYPKFALQSGAYARGTGAHVDGSSGGGAAGLAPNIYNWGAGFSVTVPLFELPVVRAQREVEQQRILAEQARASKINQDLRAQVERARALLAGARQLAAVTPRQLDAARATEQQARARYQAGLTNLVDVADAQRFLLQAEIDDGLARLAIWRAHLALAVAQGSLQPVLDAARR
ncbi:MAG: TolC family protein, partial [Bryobacterales bacterium]|nr:TolC family protein [Bryobacterales bacterium]